MSTDLVERLQAEKARREEAAKVKADNARKQAGKTRKNKTRARARLAFLFYAREGTKQISVTLISKRASISPAALYNNFKPEGDDPKGNELAVVAILEDICTQMANATIREMYRYIVRAAQEDREVSQLERVTITVNVLFRYLMRYPNMFNVEGKLPEPVFNALTRALLTAITDEDDPDLDTHQDAYRIALYHTIAMVGIRRSGLGAEFTEEEYTRRSIRRIIGQIIPVLMMATDTVDMAELERWRDTTYQPVFLRLQELPSYQRFMNDLMLRVLLREP